MKGILLLSGGIDSPVAGYLMLRQGIELTAVHMDARPHSDEEGYNKARSLANRLGELAGKKIPLYVVPYARLHEEAAQKCKAKIHCLICKRYMYRVASAVAEKEKADAIITGESLGQVASQTLDNLKVLTEAADAPVLRPLIGFDKEETIRIARRIGTYDLSSAKSCGCPFVPVMPSTKAKLNDILREESEIDILALMSESLSGSGVV